MVSDARPRFTIVSAVYNVAPYLPDFIDSLETQSRGLEGVEILMVDDGSTDDSPQILAAWAERRPGTVRVVTQPNAGQGAARNTGIREARGEWITFPDPDDVLAPTVPRGGRHLPRGAPRRPPGRDPPDDLARRVRHGRGHPPAALDVPCRPLCRPHAQPGALPRQLSRIVLPARPDPRAGPGVRRSGPPELRGRPLQLSLPARPPPTPSRLPRLGPVPLPQARRRELHAPDVPGPSRSLRGGDGARLPRRGAACPRAVRRGAQLAGQLRALRAGRGTSP